MKILFLTQYDESGASSRHCVYDYLLYFRKAGHEVSVRPLIRGDVYKILGGLADKSIIAFLGGVFRILRHFSGRWIDVIHAWKYDVVIIQKDVLPFGLQALLRLGQKNIVFMTDDPIWLEHPGAGSNPILRKILCSYRRSLLKGIMRKARLVIADSPAIRDYATTYCKESVWLRTGIPLSLYKGVPARTNRDLVVGWIGSPSTTYLLKRLLPYLEQIAKEIPFRLINLSSDPVEWKGINIENGTWNQQNELVALSQFDIGLMPADSGEFNQSRFSRKYLTYGCARVPTLASRNGQNIHQIQHGRNGYLYDPDDSADFVEKCKALLRDATLRKRLGDAAYDDIEKRYEISLVGADFVRLIERQLETSLSREGFGDSVSFAS